MNESDRELLEAAAMAAGMPTGTGLGQFAWCSAEKAMVRANANGTATAWNPLTDDGDALRLAVKLGLLNFQTELITALWAARKAADPMAATRRAIVRAAAIGSQQA